MKRSTQLLTLAFVVLLTLASVTAGCVTSNTSPSSVTTTSTPATSAASPGMATYQNTSWGVKFSYPMEWYARLFKNEGTGDFFIIQPFYDPMLGCQMAFSRYNKAPYESANGTDAALNYVNRSIANNKNGPFTVVQEGVAIRKNDTAYTDYKVVQGPTRVTLAGTTGWKYVASYNYTRDGERPERTFMTIVTTHGNYFYVISYGGPPKDYNRYLTTAQKIIDSYEFI